MTGPFIFIATNRLKPAAYQAERHRVPGLVEFIKASEPRLLAFNEYIDAERTEVTVVQVHPGAQSMEFHSNTTSRGLESGRLEPRRRVPIGPGGTTLRTMVGSSSHCCRVVCPPVAHARTGESSVDPSRYQDRREAVPPDNPANIPSLSVFGRTHMAVRVHRSG